MGFILVAIVLAIIGEVFLCKLYRDGEKQFEKYDRDHSDIQVSSAEEFVARIKTIPNMQISKAESFDNKVDLVCENNKYEISVENGVAAVNYDRAGVGLRISRIGRMFKMFQFSKSANKAIIINSVMDCVAGKDLSVSEEEYKKVKTDRNLLNILFVSMIACLIIGGIRFTGETHDNAISKVQSTEYSSGVTYGQIVEGYIVSPEWTAFNSENDTAIVEVTGTSVENEKICIQFSGNSGMGFNTVGSQTFEIVYFEVDGESIDYIAAMDYLVGYLGY